MIRPKACVEIRCDGGCDEEWPDGVPHFTDEAEALAEVRAAGWLVMDGRHLCQRCAATAECAAMGHVWDEESGGDGWEDRSDPVVGAYRFRQCERCWGAETDPPVEALTAVRHAALVVGRALETGGAP